MGITHVLAAHPDLAGFFNSILASQVFYIIISVALGYCIVRHPVLPNWNAIALLVSTLYWTLRYYEESLGQGLSTILDYGWVLSTPLEIAFGISLLVTGRRMLAHANSSIDTSSANARTSAISRII